MKDFFVNDFFVSIALNRIMIITSMRLIKIKTGFAHIVLECAIVQGALEMI